MHPLRQAVEHIAELLTAAFAPAKIRPAEPDDPDLFLKTDLARIAGEALAAGRMALAGLPYKKPRSLLPTWFEEVQEIEPTAQSEYQALAFWTETILDELAISDSNSTDAVTLG
jgi:hypothetical protein